MISFHDLYERYAQDVSRFAYWLCGSAAEAEDITAETFFRAWINFDKIQTATVKAYLFTIARNLYLQQRRDNHADTPLDLEWVDPEPGPAALAEIREELERVRRQLQVLSEIDRAVFIMRVQAELPYEEIARVLGLSPSAVKVKVHRARLKLAQIRLEVE